MSAAAWVGVGCGIIAALFFTGAFLSRCITLGGSPDDDYGS